LIGYFVTQAIRAKVVVTVRSNLKRSSFLRRIMSAELIAMRVSQVPKLDLPSKSVM
jgi:hypothetical protein